MSFHMFLSFAFSFHLVTPIVLKSSSTSWSQRLRGRPILFLPNTTPCNNLLGIRLSAILSTWPSHSIRRIFIN
uniref:Putative secreted protein n=1 Tax=Panstrongylus lignarius TaxID=156445 RepID=A0A224Y696_9HEMI